jgi:hypothetical protein
MDAEPLPRRLPAPAAEPYQVRISDPGELAAALPHLLGFRPRESIVVVGLGGSSGFRVGLTVRADLPPPRQRQAAARDLVRRLVSDGPTAALVAVVSEAADLGGPMPDLPHRSLVHALVLALDAAGLAVRDALLVRSGRWWSYDCPQPCCAPGAGTPLPGGVSALAAASVAAGVVVADDRADLAARIAPDPSAAMPEVIERVGSACAGALAVRGSDAVAAESWRAVRAAVARMRSRPAPRLSDDEVARLLWGLHDRTVRDRALGLALQPDPAAVEQLWTECTRRARSPLVAAPATLLAVTACLRGDGAMAGAALERALDCDPRYRLARQLATALAACVPPADIRAVVAGALEELGDPAGAA